MSTNPEEIVQQVRAEFERLLTSVMTPSPEGVPTVYELEGGLFERLLVLGRSLMTLAFVCAAERSRRPTATDAGGQILPYHSEKSRAFVSLFGKIRFSRSYYWRGRGSGWFPLDAALNLPASSISDRVREWRELLGVDLAYHPAGAILRRFLGIEGSSRSLSAEVAAEAPAIEAYYEQAGPLEPDPDATLLIVQADGKGVPMIRLTPAEPKVRPGKGEKTAKKKEAIATAVYTQAPRVRTPEEVLGSLFAPSPRPPREPDAGSGPVNKRVWATLEGKAAALAFTAGQAQRQEGAHIVARVALTDGSEALQDQVRQAFPDYLLVLDFIHVDEYLWKVANALLGETAPDRTEWVKTRARQVLSGEVRAVIEEFRTLAQAPERTVPQRATLEQVAHYYEKNAASMAYDRCLAQGWPIATGVIEGTCRHLVKDRCERSGMRWTQAGAEALLRLRSVAENGDWDRFHAYRRATRQRERYGVGSDTGGATEALLMRGDSRSSFRLAA